MNPPRSRPACSRCSTQAASSNANTLDDYEEGSWTPVLGGSGGTSGQTYGTRSGNYVKIGQFVWAQFYFDLTAKGTITGSAQLQQLPFTVGGTSGYTGVCIGRWQGFNTAMVWVGGYAEAGNTYVNLQGITAAATSSGTNLVTGDFTNTTGFIGSLVFQATA